MASHDTDELTPAPGEKVVCINQNGVVRKFIVPIASLLSSGNRQNAELPPIAEVPPVHFSAASNNSVAVLPATSQPQTKQLCKSKANITPTRKNASSRQPKGDVTATLNAIDKVAEQLREFNEKNGPSTNEAVAKKLQWLANKASGLMKTCNQPVAGASLGGVSGNQLVAGASLGNVGGNQLVPGASLGNVSGNQLVAGASMGSVAVNVLNGASQTTDRLVKSNSTHQMGSVLLVPPLQAVRGSAPASHRHLVVNTVTPPSSQAPSLNATRLASQSLLRNSKFQSSQTSNSNVIRKATPPLPVVVQNQQPAVIMYGNQNSTSLDKIAQPFPAAQVLVQPSTFPQVPVQPSTFSQVSLQTSTLPVKSNNFVTQNQQPIVLTQNTVLDTTGSNKQALVLNNATCLMNPNLSGMMIMPSSIPASPTQPIVLGTPTAQTQPVVLGTATQTDLSRLPTLNSNQGIIGSNLQPPLAAATANNQIIILGPDGSVAQVLHAPSIQSDSNSAQCVAPMPSKVVTSSVNENRTVNISINGPGPGTLQSSEQSTNRPLSSNQMPALSHAPAVLISTGSRSVGISSSSQQRTPTALRRLLPSPASTEALTSLASTAALSSPASTAALTSQASSAAVTSANSPFSASLTAGVIATPTSVPVPQIVNVPHSPDLEDSMKTENTDDVIILPSSETSPPAQSSSNVITPVSTSSVLYANDLQGVARRVFGYTFLADVRHVVVRSDDGFHAIPVPDDVTCRSESAPISVERDHDSSGTNSASEIADDGTNSASEIADDSTNSASEIADDNGSFMELIDDEAMSDSVTKKRSHSNELPRNAIHNSARSPLHKKRRSDTDFFDISSTNHCLRALSANTLDKPEKRVTTAKPKTCKRNAIVLLHNLNIRHKDAVFNTSELYQSFSSVTSCSGSGGSFEKLHLCSEASSSRIVKRERYSGKLAQRACADGLYMKQLYDEHRYRQALYDDDTDVDCDQVAESDIDKATSSASETTLSGNEVVEITSFDDDVDMLLVNEALPVLDRCGHKDETNSAKRHDLPPKLHAYCDGRDCSECSTTVEQQSDGAPAVVTEQPSSATSTVTEQANMLLSDDVTHKAKNSKSCALQKQLAQRKRSRDILINAVREYVQTPPQEKRGLQYFKNLVTNIANRTSILPKPKQ